MSLCRNPYENITQSAWPALKCRAPFRIWLISLMLVFGAATTNAQTATAPSSVDAELQTLISGAQAAIGDNQPEAGITLAVQAYELAVSEKGASHPDALFTANLLATTYALSGRYQDAGPLFARVLEQLEAESGAPNFDKMVAHFNLADLQVLQRQWGRASENFESALSIATALGGRAQQDQIDAQSGLARIAMILGDWETAHGRYSDLLQRAASSPNQTLLPVFEWRQKRALALSKAGAHALAETAYAQILEDAVADQPFALQVRTEFAEALLRSGKLASAEAEFLSVTEQIDPEGPIGRRAYEGLGDVRDLRGRIEQAEAAYSSWNSAIQASGLSQSAEGRRALLKLARIYARSNRSDEAMALHRQILSPDTGNAVVGQSVRAAARLELADLFFAARAFDEADGLYEYVMERSERLFGLSDPTHRYALEQLAFVRQATGRLAEAQNLHLQALMNRAVFEQDCDVDCAFQLAAYAATMNQDGSASKAQSQLMFEALQALSIIDNPSPQQLVKLDIAFPEGLRFGVEQTRDQLFATDQPYQAVRLSAVVGGQYDPNAPTKLLTALRQQGQVQSTALFADVADEGLSLQRLHGELVPYLNRLGQDDVELTGIEYERFTVLKTSYASLVDGARAAYRERFLSTSNVGESEASARRQLMSAVAPGTAFVSLNLRSDAIHIAFITADRAVQRQVERSASLERDILNSRLAIYYEGRGFGDFNTTARLQTLYRTLLSPISADLVSVRGQTLVIDAQGPLRYVPFAALHDGQSYLAEHHPTALAVTPSATGVDNRNPGRSVTRFATSDDPGMRSLFAGLGFQGQIFAGEAYDSGTLTNVSSSSPDILQIESNLTLNGQNPNLSALILSNGQIPARSVLSTINGAAQDIDLLALIGAATLSDLGQDQGIEVSRLGSGADLADIYALASNPEIGAIAVSLWPLGAAQKSGVLEAFYTDWVQSDASLAEALNSAQLAALDNEETANPFHWASLTLAFGSP